MPVSQGPTSNTDAHANRVAAHFNDMETTV
jgi:hypothetical protein